MKSIHYFVYLFFISFLFVKNINSIFAQIKKNDTKKTETKKIETKKIETKKIETKKIETKKDETKKDETKTTDNNFTKLLKNFPLVTLPKKITHEELLKATQKDLDNQLAWEFFFQKNKAFKPEETNCHPVAQFNVSEKTMGIIYIKGKNNGKGNTFYAVYMKGYDRKTGTLTSTNLMPFTTFIEDGTIMAEVEIKTKGVVSFTENNTKLQKKHTQNITIK